TTLAGGTLGSTAVASAVLAPAAPGNLTATVVFSHQINLSWTNNASNASGFNILRSSDGVNFTSVATVGVYTNTFSDYFLSPATTYYYRVNATNASGAASSATVSATTTPPTIPLPASNLTATALDSRHIQLSWTDNSNPPNVEEDGFALYLSTDGVNFTWTQEPGRDVTTYIDPDILSPATTYYFYVTAYSSVAAGQSGPSNTATVTTPAVPAAPSNLTATAASATQVNLSWTDNSVSPAAATSFKIYQSNDNITFNWIATTG